MLASIGLKREDIYITRTAVLTSGG
jgi:hypothetical protein